MTDNKLDWWKCACETPHGSEGCPWAEHSAADRTYKLYLEELERLWQKWHHLASTPGSHFSDIYRAELACSIALRNAAPELFARVRRVEAQADVVTRDNVRLQSEVAALRARIETLEFERGSQWKQFQDRIVELERQVEEDEEVLEAHMHLGEAGAPVVSPRINCMLCERLAARSKP